MALQKPEFEIYIDRDGQYRWRLRAKNGEIVAASESYPRHQQAVNSAYRVKEISSEAIVTTVVPKDRQN